MLRSGAEAQEKTDIALFLKAGFGRPLTDQCRAQGLAGGRQQQWYLHWLHSFYAYCGIICPSRIGTHVYGNRAVLRPRRLTAELKVDHGAEGRRAAYERSGTVGAEL